jgi:hypothetical protein
MRSKNMEKKYFLPANEIKPLAVGYGACIASDQITAEGKKVGFMYREEPSPSVQADSGWRFFSGEEAQEYVDDANNLCFYDINTIANYDNSIIPFLVAPIGSAFGKNEKDEFEEEEMPNDPDDA